MHRMNEWVNNGSSFGQDIATLHADNTRIDTVIRLHHGTGAIHADCSLLVTDAETANDELPTPNQSVTNLLYEAYGLEGEAGAKCYKAGATNTALLATSASERAKGWAEMEQAFKQIEAILGKSVSTTTTTDADGGSIFG